MSPIKATLHNKDSGTLVRTWLKVTLILITGLVSGLILVFSVDSMYKGMLFSRTATIASSLDREMIDELRLENGSDAEVRDEYRDIKTKLADIQSVNSDTTFVYLMAQSHDDQIYFLADSEPPASEDYSPRGQIYEDSSPELKQIFETKQPLIEGPITDEWGTWLSSLSPIIDPASGRLIAVAGIDIPASNYIGFLALAGLTPLLIALIVSGLVIITDRIRRRRLEALHFRSELVSIASHELRTPLTGIRWSEETLLKQPLSDIQAKTMQALYDSTLRLQESIEDILQLANLQGLRSQELQLVPTDVKELIEGIFATQNLPAAQKQIKLTYGKHWPTKLIINCDAVRMKRVFNNIISNAIKYTRDDTTITVDYKKTAAGHVFSVKDQGIGIPKAEQFKVFSGFYRATNALKKQTTGTGMGLYLSQTTINQHGGKLWLDSKENLGTTVHILLPCDK